MKFMAERMKIVVEPTGCLAMAGMRKAIRENPEKFKGKKIGVIISGGNVELAKFAKLITS